MIPEPAKTDGDTSWFVHDRFGLFIHWGLYALAARHEWIKSREKIRDEDYEKYFEHFDPDLYDPSVWAAAAAGAGMKYFVVTTKHHEGFCLWDSALTNYKSTNTPYGKDLLRPMVSAFRDHGLKVGFYHSLLDWHHPDYTVDSNHPLRDNAEAMDANAGKDMGRYREYLRGQTRELLTQFGRVDILWYDFSWADKGKNDWGSEELIKLVRELQPSIIMNDRLQIDQDIKTPEQYQPRDWVKVDGRPVVWEACHTFSGSWGYHRDEESWKSLEQLVRMLIDSVSKGGNLLLNVGPTGRGEFDARTLGRLSGIGEWMRLHARSIYGCTQAPSELQAPRDCRLTFNPTTNRLYVHLFAWPFEELHLDRMEGRIGYAQLLTDASEIKVLTEPTWHGGQPIASGSLILQLPVKKPNVTVPVIEIFLK